MLRMIWQIFCTEQWTHLLWTQTTNQKRKHKFKTSYNIVKLSASIKGCWHITNMKKNTEQTKPRFHIRFWRSCTNGEPPKNVKNKIIITQLKNWQLFNAKLYYNFLHYHPTTANTWDVQLWGLHWQVNTELDDRDAAVQHYLFINITDLSSPSILQWSLTLLRHK